MCFEHHYITSNIAVNDPNDLRSCNDERITKDKLIFSSATKLPVIEVVSIIFYMYVSVVQIAECVEHMLEEKE